MTHREGATRLLEAKGVVKNFGAVSALTDASLTVHSGEIVALMGANGAGKSTLVKILTGVLSADGGTVMIKGQSRKVGSPAEARKSGLVPVYQEPSLVPDLDVADNLRLGNTPVDAFRHWMGELGLPGLRLDELIRHLPLATLRTMDLARALASEPDVLLLDEMTAALPTDLVEKVRDGRTVGSLPIEPGVEERVVELMLGAKLDAGTRAAERREMPRTADRPRLRVAGLASGLKLRNVSFDADRGEVLGVVALQGQGQDELFDVLAGFRRPDKGSIEIDGVPQRFDHPADAIRAGLALVPGNRADALLMQQSVRDNIALPFSARIANWGRLDLKHEASRVTGAIERLQIDTRAQGHVRRLSGGNQQKVTIARWLATGVETLLLFDPTRGIDVRTKRQIYPLVRELADQGALVLYYTSELAEVQLACDRVVVIFNGRVVDVIDASGADEATLMRAAYGLTERDRKEVTA